MGRQRTRRRPLLPLEHRPRSGSAYRNPRQNIVRRHPLGCSLPAAFQMCEKFPALSLPYRVVWTSRQGWTVSGAWIGGGFWDAHSQSFAIASKPDGKPKKEPDSNFLEPGIYLATTYSHRTYRPNTIGAAAFHFRVRKGTGWFHRALVTRGQSRRFGTVSLGTKS